MATWGSFPRRSSVDAITLNGSPLDPTTARGFLEPGEHPDGPDHRRLAADMVTRFCLDHAGDRRGTGVPAAGPAPADPPPMEDLGRDPLLTVFRMR